MWRSFGTTTFQRWHHQYLLSQRWRHNWAWLTRKEKLPPWGGLLSPFIVYIWQTEKPRGCFSLLIRFTWDRQNMGNEPVFGSRSSMKFHRGKNLKRTIAPDDVWVCLVLFFTHPMPWSIDLFMQEGDIILVTRPPWWLHLKARFNYLIVMIFLMIQSFKIMYHYA